MKHFFIASQRSIFYTKIADGSCSVMKAGDGTDYCYFFVGGAGGGANIGGINANILTHGVCNPGANTI
ncbi:MAG: hypothetical protein LBP19_00700 [Treponema sp.]|jgi:hypothetical protein|nr:hypothetical protein [Treponema sp.]